MTTFPGANTNLADLVTRCPLWPCKRFRVIPQFAGDGRRRQAHGQPMLDGFHVDPGWAAAIGAALLRRGDPLDLALAAQVGLELRKDAEHVEERFAGSGRGVHRLFGGSQMRVGYG